MKILKCDLCGKIFNLYDEQEKFGLHYNNIGYGSAYDGQDIHIDMCCDCFDNLMADYIVPRLIKQNENLDDYIRKTGNWNAGE